MKDTLSDLTGLNSHEIKPKKNESIRQAIFYLIRKAFLISVVIFIGIFLTILLINRSVKGNTAYKPQMDKSIMQGINRTIQIYEMEHWEIYDLPREERIVLLDDMRQDLIKQSGLNDPYLLKHLRWTVNALGFNWGGIKYTYARPLSIFAQGRTHFNLNDIILQYLPMTLLLVTTSYLAIILLGLPLALFLSQNSNKWYDRLISIVAPISSVPSWVIGILLITIFAIEIRFLPMSGILDMLPPETKWGYIPIILKHMILPCLAIFLSLFFQLVYSWRTIFVTFGDEDYVELGKAVGMKPKKWRNNFILKPTLPYVITSFSLILISFWQLTMALETVFDWRGIGWLYVNVALPNFWGESMYPGELIIALQLVVLFAYLLGIVVFILDIVYMLVDPRIRFFKKQPTITPLHTHTRRIKRDKIKPRFDFIFNEKLVRSTLEIKKPHRSIKDIYFEFSKAFREFAASIKKIFVIIWRYPSAIIGLIILLLLICGSLYAVIGLPFVEIGSEWGRNILTGKPTIPKLAKPAWTNLFRSQDYLSTLIMDSEKGGNISRTEFIDTNGFKQIELHYDIDYPYADFPSDMTLYFKGVYNLRKPFVTMTWITPDGREFPLSGMAIGKGNYYDFSEHINVRRIISTNEHLEKWFNLTRVDTTPNFHILFADPGSDTPQVVNGTYQLIINGLTFEEANDIQGELVLLGHVYGLAGTDNSRRDLVVPLFWGMPIALVIGLTGSLTTTLLSMAFAATGVWFGGWVDDLIQRITDINLILPFMAIGVLAVAYLGINIWVILIIMVFLNIFGSPLKNFRSALLQIKEAPYIESARAYGAGNIRIIIKYMIPKIIPVLIPQLVILIPSFVFLEATLGIFNIRTDLPTWGTMIYQGLTAGALFGSRYWVLEPIFLLLITGIAFVLLGTALEKILNPRLLEK